MKKIATLFLSVLLLAAAIPTVSAFGYDVVCEPQFNMAEPFEHNIAKVSKNTKWALADKSGAAFTGYDWDAMGEVSSEYIPAKKGTLWGYITPAGVTKIAYQYSMAGAFSEGIALVQKTDGRYVYINTSGQEVFASPFVYSFSPSEGAICGMANTLYGYCDTEGNIIITPQFEMACDFHEGYAAVKSDGKWGFITSYGSYCVRPAYDFVSDFKNKHAICRLAGKYGIINTSGTKTAPFTFDYIGLPDDAGRYPAKSGSISGFIDTKGNWILKTEYDYCYPFTDGVARVYKDGLWGYINESGVELVPPTFADCGAYYNGVAPFSLDGYLWGYLSLDLSTVAKPTPTPPAPSTEDNTPKPEPSLPVVQNPADDGTLPLAPTTQKCISLRIGSLLARKGEDSFSLAAAPTLVNGNTLIPVRGVTELLGGSVTWNAESKRISISRNYINVSMTIGSKICYVNGVPGYLTTAPTIIDGSTMVPIRSITDAFGCTIEWIAASQNVYIYY